jgi:chemotaxis signal transduction protein
MGRASPGLVPRSTRDINHQEIDLSLINTPDRPAHDPDGRPVRPSTSVASASWRDRVRSRTGIEELLTFHIGGERFATSLAAIEEAVERPDVYRVPEMRDSMLGVFSLRGRLIPVCSPVRAFGVELRAAEATVLLLRMGARHIGVAVDDVDDVITLDLALVRPAPGIDDADGVLLGVVRQGNDLIAIVDPDAIVAACLSGQIMETT